MKKKKKSSYYAIAVSYTGILLILLSLLFTSCSVNQEITQRQLTIQKEIDILQADIITPLTHYIEYYKKDLKQNNHGTYEIYLPNGR